jgi:hypothetical protein
MKRGTIGNDAHAGLWESHPGHEGGSVRLPAESAMAVSTPKRGCCGNEAQRAAHALAREFAHRVIRLTLWILSGGFRRREVLVGLDESHSYPGHRVPELDVIDVLEAIDIVHGERVPLAAAI